MDMIVIGIYSFNAEVLREKTVKEAKEMFSKLPGQIVTEAWKKANPKRSAKSSKKED